MGHQFRGERLEARGGKRFRRYIMVRLKFPHPTSRISHPKTEGCPSGLRSWSWKPVTPQGAVGSNPTSSASIRRSTQVGWRGRFAKPLGRVNRRAGSNPAFSANTRAFSSVGQSVRLITGRSGVRVPEGPPIQQNLIENHLYTRSERWKLRASQERFLA